MIVKSQRAAHLPTPTELLQMKAMEPVTEKNITTMAFKASRYWVHRFMHCIGLSLRGPQYQKNYRMHMKRN